jgi:hypothetical protein
VEEKDENEDESTAGGKKVDISGDELVSKFTIPSPIFCPLRSHNGRPFDDEEADFLWLPLPFPKLPMLKCFEIPPDSLASGL